MNDERKSRLRHWGWIAVGIALYAALIVVTTWPVARYLDSRLSMGMEPTRTVPLFNAWTIWWNAESVSSAGSGYWDAPLFVPAKNTFALSEPQPTTLIVAPIIWITGSVALAYNLYLWLALLLNGCVTQWCLQSMRIHPCIAIGGGAAMLLLPVVHWQLGVLQLVPIWGIVWTWWAMEKWIRRVQQTQFPTLTTTIWRGSEIGIAFGTSFLMCVHHGLFLALLMVASAWMLGRYWLRPRVCLGLVIAVLVSGLMIGPILVPLHEMASVKEFVRPRATVQQLSLVPGDYTAVYGQTLIDWPVFGAQPGWWMSPGFLKWIWALVGLVAGLLVVQKRWWTGYIAVMIGMAIVLSLGTNLKLGSWEPWWTLAELVPGFAQVRNVFRFGFFVQIGVVLLAAQGIDWLSRWAGERRMATGSWRSGMWAVGQGVVVLLGVWSVVDPWPYRQQLGVLPSVSFHRDWIQYLQEHSKPEEAVLCLPMPGGQTVRDYEIETDWMMLGTVHKLPLANGYSGFFPQAYYDVQWDVLNSGVTIPVASQLYKDGIRWIVIDRRRFSSPWGDLWILGDLHATRVIGDGKRVDLYQIGPSGG